MHTAPILGALGLPSFMAGNRSPWPGDNAHVGARYAAVCLPVCMLHVAVHTRVYKCVLSCMFVRVYIYMNMDKHVRGVQK